MPQNHEAPSWRFRLQRLIEREREKLDAWLAPHDSTGTLRYLAAGTRKPGGSLEFLMTLGFVHVLSASGIHLYALASTWGAAIRWIAPRAGLSVGLGLWLARLASFVSWTLCWLASGARPGMLRPWLVVLMRRGAANLGIRWHKWAPLAIALGVDLLVAAWRNDLEFHSGRWIYALAVGGGMMAKTHAGVAVGSWVLAALWQAHEENLAACATPVLSGLTLPVFSSLLFPLVYLSYALQIEPLAAFCGWLSDHFISTTSFVTMSARTLWVLPHWALGAGMALAFFAMAFFSFRQRVALLIVVAVLSFSWRGREASSRVEQLDVGQGDAALIGSGMIDTGSERALTESAWVRLLAAREINHLSWIALTHLDEDHAGGVLKLASLVPIDCIATSRAQIETPRGKRLEGELAKFGVRLSDWESGCVPFAVLGPEAHAEARARPRSQRQRGSKRGSANADMSAIFVPLRGGGFYLNAGDAHAHDELRIGAWAADMRSSAPRILKISHHGSRTSTSREFLRMVRPTEAWISSGSGNSFGHPTAQVLDLLARENIPVRRTDTEGVIQLHSSAKVRSLGRR